MKKIVFCVLLFLIFTVSSVSAQAPYTAQGSFGAVSCGHPMAVKAAMDILNKGGNAVDAAVACAFMMGAADFSNSGLGGDGFVLIAFPNGKVAALDGSSRRPDDMPRPTKELVQSTSAIGLPTATSMLLKMLRLYGSKWPAEVIAPAANACLKGIPITAYLEKVIAKKLLEIKDPAAVQFLAPNGIPLRAGQIIHQPVLAATLMQIGSDGGLSFYKGHHASVLVKDMQKRGSLYRDVDFYKYYSPAVSPIIRRFKGYKIYGTPSPSSSEATMVLAEKLVEAKVPLFPKNQAEALRLASFCRKGVDAKYLYMAESFKKPGYFLPNAEKNVFSPKLPKENNTDSQTTHICTADANGMMVSMTLTLGNHFGSGELSPLGFFYCNAMRNFTVGASYPENYPESAGPVSSKSPIIVTRNQKPVMALGGAGADRIITNTARVLAAQLSELDPVKALRSPRVFLDYKNTLKLEWHPLIGLKPSALPRHIKAEVLQGCDDYFGLVSLITRTKEGLCTAAADHRRDGACGALTSPEK